ncbi:SPOR domain-containing protein [Paenibacillus bouchesdurhonensis]|uniref:SPOR domain-containing protein n=1 Tax=Paenibacillus bouchesdurhonensis TaxID=1870990 RepID=UPI001F35D66A|nr:SPOR domain-containing protein [Paenibacillus bouchesdurhonensis]
MNKAKMTFRFDEQGRVARYAGAAGESQKNESSPARSTREVYEISGESRIPPPLTYRAVESADYWGDPLTDQAATGIAVFPEHEKPDGGNYYFQRTRTSWWKVVGSLTGAVVTGALFGFVVLSMFNQEITVPIPGIGVPKQEAAGEAADIPVLGSVISKEQMPLVQVVLPSQSYHFLQYGVFSTAEGVELAQQQLRDSGIAAARDTLDEKRVYAGVSPDREEAKLLSGRLKTGGVHLILHEISLPESATVEYNGDAASLQQYLAQSADLVYMLSSSSAALLGEASPTRQSQEETGQLRESHQLWTKSAALIRGKLSASAEGEVKEMEKAMNSAVEAMGEFNEKGEQTMLWEVQNEMMRFIMAEQKLVGNH